jgi:hypothetical protein
MTISANADVVGHSGDSFYHVKVLTVLQVWGVQVVLTCAKEHIAVEIEQCAREAFQVVIPLSILSVEGVCCIDTPELVQYPTGRTPSLVHSDLPYARCALLV